MIEIEQQTLIDYASLDNETRILIQDLDTELALVLKRTAEEIGLILLKAKDGLPHGLYMPWIASKGMSETTAWRCMQIAQGKELKSFKMKDLTIEVVEQPVEPVEEGLESRKLRVTNKDKQATLEEYFAGTPPEEWESNVTIAEMCGVTEGTVRNYRKELRARQQKAIEQERIEAASSELIQIETEVAVADVEPEIAPEPMRTVEEPEEEESSPEPEAIELALRSPEEPEPESEQSQREMPGVEPEQPQTPEREIVQEGIVEPEQVSLSDDLSSSEKDEQVIPSQAIAPEILEDALERRTEEIQARRQQKEQEREQRREVNRRLIAQARTIDEVLRVAKFSTIVIDPPWDWSDEGDVDQMGRAKPAYGTMSIEELLDLQVGTYAEEDCHLYLWITNRSLPKGFRLLEKWGFRYITCITWKKPSFGMGNYFRGQTEQLLFGVKGSLMLKRKNASTFFEAPRGPNGHSSKPVESYGFIESCSPGPYLELFARSERSDWTSWGAEV